MKNVFDVTDFGAVANSKIDSTKAIQAAIDEAAKVKGAVIIPPGKYLCGYIKLYPSVTLEGYHGWGYREMGGSVLVLSDENVPCLLDLTGAHGAHVKGIQFNGNKLLGKNIHGIMINWPHYSGGTLPDSYDEGDVGVFRDQTHSEFREDSTVIHDCQCKNFSGDGMHFNHVFAFTVSDCHSMSNKGHGIYVNGYDGWIHDCMLSVNLGAGISFENGCAASVTILGNRIEWNAGGGIVFCGGNSLTINNNFFDRAYGPSIHKKGDGKFSDTTISGNLFRRSGKPREVPFENEYESCHVYLSNCENLVVSGNSCKAGIDDGGVGVLSPDYSFVLKDLHSCVVKDNVMRGGYVKEAIVELGDNSDNNIIKDNVW